MADADNIYDARSADAYAPYGEDEMGQDYVINHHCDPWVAAVQDGMPTLQKMTKMAKIKPQDQME